MVAGGDTEGRNDFFMRENCASYYNIVKPIHDRVALRKELAVL